MKRYIFFDLDGTLTDPMLGITSSVQYALAKFGISVRYRAAAGTILPAVLRILRGTGAGGGGVLPGIFFAEGNL